MIFQEPMTSLNPVLTIGRQLTEGLEIHLGMTPGQARERAVELLALVGIPDPGRRLGQYPHQFSGGMRQRMMIAMALACQPALILADEPTTALDVTIQAQILELMKDLSRRFGVAMLMITHNLGVVARYADRVNVMYAGRIIEQGDGPRAVCHPAPSIHPGPAALGAAPGRAAPRPPRPDRGPAARPHAAAAGLRLRSALRLSGGSLPGRGARAAVDRQRRPCQRVLGGRAGHRRGGPSALLRRAHGEAPRRVSGDGLLRVRDLVKHFEVSGGVRRPRGIVRAVDGVSFDIHRGETLGLVGESGCGKTTTGRCILRSSVRRVAPSLFEGRDLATLDEAELRAVRRRMQVIFQDPYSSLNPRMTVGQIIGEPLGVHGW